MRDILRQKRNNVFQFAVAALLLLFVSLQGQITQLQAADNTQSAQKETAYPETPEGVVEAFVKASYSEEAIKRYWLNMTDDKLEEHKKYHNIHFDCRTLRGTADPGIYDNFTIKRTKDYNIENDEELKSRRYGITNEMRQRARKGEIAEVSAFFNASAAFPSADYFQQFQKRGKGKPKITLGIVRSSQDRPICHTYRLIKANNRWKIEGESVSNECFKMLDDYYTKKYKDKKYEYMGSDRLTDYPISKECLVEGIKNMIEEYKDDKGFILGLKDCLKAIEENRECRAYLKKIKTGGK